MTPGEWGGEQKLDLAEPCRLGCRLGVYSARATPGKHKLGKQVQGRQGRSWEATQVVLMRSDAVSQIHGDRTREPAGVHRHKHGGLTD